MTDDSQRSTGEQGRDWGFTRRGTLGALGAAAMGVGVSATGSVSASEDDGYMIEDSGPNEDPVEIMDGGNFFHSSPEFPPFTNFEKMLEDARNPDTPFTPGDVNKYLQPHGHPNLLGSKRQVIEPGEETEDGYEPGDPADWEEFSDASATATVTNAPTGWGREKRRSRIKIEFEGLYPGYAYTVWAVHRPAWHRPIGGNRGDKNYFRPDENGEYTLEVFDRPDELTLPPGATEDDGEAVPITDYPLHEIPGEFFFVVAYHYDDRLWGSQPGPYWVPQLVINDFGDGDDDEDEEENEN